MGEYFTWVMCVVFYVGVVSGWYSHHPSPEWYNPDGIIHGTLFLLLPLKLSRLWCKPLATRTPRADKEEKD